MAKIILILVVCWLLAFLSSRPALANMQINEISPSSNPEWVELYNNGSDSVDLSGWYLVDSSDKQMILSGVVPGNSLVIFEHATGWLNNSLQSGKSYADILSLYNNASPSGLIDQIEFGAIDGEESVGRTPDGSGQIVVGLDQTKGQANPQPTPTTTPATTSTPTSSPTPSPTASPVLVSRLTATPSPTKAPTLKPSPSTSLATKEKKLSSTSTASASISASTSSKSLVLGTQTKSNPAKTETGESPSANNWPRLLGWLGVLAGLSLMAGALVLALNKFNVARGV